MNPIRQHLIDPEICIRCNTCEDICPINAITHNDDNYLVNAEICDLSMDCIAPCPTGAIDNWRLVETPYTLEQQGEWEELPPQQVSAEVPGGGDEALESEANGLLDIAHAGQGGKGVAPATASTPSINIYTRDKPAVAVVQGNVRITHADAESDVHHIILDLGSSALPVLEGQSVGVVPPGADPNGKPHVMRLYSIASPRDGERPNHNNIALTVKRVEYQVDGRTVKGIASNYLCDLQRGDKVNLTGPFGSSFLMPNHPQANIIMICTGTGSAPFRAMTEHRRRHMPDAPGRLLLFFGARTRGELPYFGPLMKLPSSLIDRELVFSRETPGAKEYVQDRMLKRADDIFQLLQDENTHIFLCGLKAMDQGVFAALESICRNNGVEWSSLSRTMRDSGRFHVETY
ncbi:MAG: benzoyl-CoA 2,3-epoxidase subunit BoxA [Gammaproteobacteria bacterium]|nr:benzoyl-CoA 2,3-epoxidase subunit BoxA [Gammaproteobacteria bacterium]